MKELDTKLNAMCRISEVGVSDVISGGSDVDETFVSNYLKQIEFRNGKYYVPLPLKEDHKELQSNLKLCLRRLDDVVNRLKRIGLLGAYCDVLGEHLSEGYTEEVPASENPWDEEGSHFLAHFFVLKDSETTPLRIVFAANAGRVSLNDCLETGPCLLKNLHDLLIRFRVHNIALVADIARAFLSIGLLEKHRNLVKFLWFRNNDPSQDIVVYRYTTVVFGNTSSPFSLGIVLQKHLEQFESDTASDLNDKLYMDNLVTGVDTEQQALNYYYTARAIMKAGGFNLRQWLSNSDDLNRITEIEGTQTKSTTVSVLGQLWNAEMDTITFQKKSLVPSDSEKVTKRSVLSSVASVFDPTGLLTPVTIKARLYVSHLWQEMYGWDTELPPAESDTWRAIAGSDQ